MQHTCLSSHSFPPLTQGVTGGVTAMAGFQQKFFPDVYERTVLGISDTSPYCK